jgi:hypothetical protein
MYAQFMAQLALANRGWKGCLIRGAGTRMALWFYAMIRLICLQQPLKATIHQQKILDLALTNSAKGAVHDIKDDNFWKCMYIPLCAVFPALRALWVCNSNTHCTDKLYYLSHRTMVAIEKSQDELNDKNLFGSLNSDQSLLDEGNIALGSNLNNSADIDEDNIVFHDNPPVDNVTDDEDSDDEPETPGNTTMSFARQVSWHWNKHKLRIEHEYSITAATGADAMFGDNINFNLQLEKFGVNTNILKEPAVERTFCLWVEE